MYHELKSKWNGVDVHLKCDAPAMGLGSLATEFVGRNVPRNVLPTNSATESVDMDCPRQQRIKSKSQNIISKSCLLKKNNKKNVKKSEKKPENLIKNMRSENLTKRISIFLRTKYQKKYNFWKKSESSQNHNCWRYLFEERKKMSQNLEKIWEYHRKTEIWRSKISQKESNVFFKQNLQKFTFEK